MIKMEDCRTPDLKRGSGKEETIKNICCKTARGTTQVSELVAHLDLHECNRLGYMMKLSLQ